MARIKRQRLTGTKKTRTGTDRKPTTGSADTVKEADTAETIDSANDADLGTPSWIETQRGFPVGGLGADPGPRRDDEVLAATPAGDFTGAHVDDLIAFTEFLTGTALDEGDRNWLSDKMAAEFVKDPQAALNEMVRVTNAVTTIPGLEPFERADTRHKAVTGLYQTEPIRIEHSIPETPIMTLLKAHNPALLIDKTGVVVTTDAVEYRHQINDLILSLGGRSLSDLPHIRSELTEQYQNGPVMMKAELAGSQIRLVVLRTWLAEQPQSDMDQLRARLSNVIDTATDLDLVTLQLSFRSMIEAIGASEIED